MFRIRYACFGDPREPVSRAKLVLWQTYDVDTALYTAVRHFIDVQHFWAAENVLAACFRESSFEYGISQVTIWNSIASFVSRPHATYTEQCFWGAVGLLQTYCEGLLSWNDFSSIKAPEWGQAITLLQELSQFTHTYCEDPLIWSKSRSYRRQELLELDLKLLVDNEYENHPAPDRYSQDLHKLLRSCVQHKDWNLQSAVRWRMLILVDKQIPEQFLWSSGCVPGCDVPLDIYREYCHRFQAFTRQANNHDSFSSVHLQSPNMRSPHTTIMSEPKGTTLALIGLLGLVSTSLNFMECFPLANNQDRDLDLGVAQLALTNIRLSSWASALRMDDPASRIPANTYHELETALSHLYAEWSDLKKLDEKYGVKQLDFTRKEERFKMTNRLITIMHGLMKQKLDIDDYRQPHPGTRAKIWWAIHDKTKFDRFMTEVDKTLTSLEKITETISWKGDITVPAKQLELYNKTKDDIVQGSEEARQLLIDVEWNSFAKSTGYLYSTFF